MEQIRPHSAALQLALERARRRLTRVARDDYAGHGKAALTEIVDHPEYVHVVRDAKVSANLVGLDVGGVYADNYLGLVGKVL